MSINIKKYTKDQMAKMVEEAAERLESQKKENAELAEQLKSQTAKTIALRNKLDDTEAALGRANACIATMKVEREQQTKDLFEWRRSAQNLHDDLLNARERANYAEAHPWRNLWAWFKRKLVRHE